MAKPIIMTIDDEPHVLNAIARDLQAQYQSDYRIVKARSGAEALETVQEFKRRDTPIALFLVDQRMPAISGIEFLAEAIQLYPDSKRVLLTAYADTDAAIASINAIDLDYYLMKPWDPPEERLYPVLDDLLSDWLASVPVPYDGLRVAGTLWSASSHYVKDFLARSQIPYRWLDIERDSEARKLVEATCEGQPRLPVLFFPDGSTLVDPDLRDLADRVGLTTRAEQPFYDLIIVGGRSRAQDDRAVPQIRGPPARRSVRRRRLHRGRHRDAGTGGDHKHKETVEAHKRVKHQEKRKDMASLKK